MNILHKWLGKREQTITAVDANPKGGNTVAYVPGQKEPEEYAIFFAEITRYYEEAKPFSFPILIVGFDRETSIEQMFEKRRANKLKLEGKLKYKRVFEQRNPVIRIEYPGAFLSADTLNTLIKDMKVLRKLGATDVSAVGVKHQVAKELRAIFGEKSCPFLAIVD